MTVTTAFQDEVYINLNDASNSYNRGDMKTFEVNAQLDRLNGAPQQKWSEEGPQQNASEGEQPVRPVMEQPVRPVMGQPVRPVMGQPVRPVMGQPITTTKTHAAERPSSSRLASGLLSPRLVSERHIFCGSCPLHKPYSKSLEINSIPPPFSFPSPPL